jgi:hypothetical protein
VDTSPEDEQEPEVDYFVVEAPPGSAASQGGTGEMIVFKVRGQAVRAMPSTPQGQPATFSGVIESAGDFTSVRPGDTVYREFYGHITALKVSRIDDELIYTGDEGWMFDRRTGFEHDPDLGFGWRPGVTISRLIRTPEAGAADECSSPGAGDGSSMS